MLVPYNRLGEEGPYFLGENVNTKQIVFYQFCFTFGTDMGGERNLGHRSRSVSG